MTNSYDAIVIGAGQSGPLLAVRLAEAGRKRADRGARPRRHVRQQRLHPDEDADRERARSARGPARGRWGVDRRHVPVDMKKVKARRTPSSPTRRRPRQVARGDGEPDAGARPRALQRAARSRRRRDVRGAAIFVNVGGRPVLRMPGIDDVPVLTNASMMDLDTLPEHLIVVGGSYIGLEFAQMYRRFGSRVTVLECGAADRARGPRRLAEVPAILELEASRSTSRCRNARTARAPRARHACHGRQGEPTARRSKAATCSSRSAASRTPMTSASRGPASSSMRAATSRSTTSSGPASRHLGDRRLQRPRRVHPHLLQRLRDRRREPARRRQAPRQRPPDLCALHRPAARPRRHERGGGARARQVGLVGVRPMTRVGRANERGETQGFMKVLVDAETSASSAPRCSASRATRSSTAARHHGRRRPTR